MGAKTIFGGPEFVKNIKEVILDLDRRSDEEFTIDWLALFHQEFISWLETQSMPSDEEMQRYLVDFLSRVRRVFRFSTNEDFAAYLINDFIPICPRSEFFSIHMGGRLGAMIRIIDNLTYLNISLQKKNFSPDSDPEAVTALMRVCLNAIAYLLLGNNKWIPKEAAVPLMGFYQKENSRL